MKKVAILCFLTLSALALISFAADTNSPPPTESLDWKMTVSTNGEVRFGSILVARIQDKTNWVPVPDLAAMASSHNTGFMAGARCGIVAVKRNQDVENVSELIRIAGLIYARENQVAARK